MKHDTDKPPSLVSDAPGFDLVRSPRFPRLLAYKENHGACAGAPGRGDARNVFALSSVLERRGMRVLTATTGSEAIDVVKSTPELAIVLMDIMMPEMDGYETMEAIRADPAFHRLPIIALTAKAMKGDREKCLEAGASDYLAKPVNTEQLLSALRMWLHR